MGIIGGDLGAMTAALGTRFGQAGTTFQSQSTAISRRVRTALEEFTAEMRTLDVEAKALATEIKGEMTRLDTQATGTEWTGSNREQMDGIVATLDDDLVRIRGAIESFVDEASSVVNGALTQTMTDLSSNVETAGTNAQLIANGFATNVENQRTAFDQVLNG